MRLYLLVTSHCTLIHAVDLLLSLKHRLLHKQNSLLAVGFAQPVIFRWTDSGVVARFAHQVCDFLNYMVRALSSYYGPKGVRILPTPDGTMGGGPSMYPRMYFCQALKQVIDNGLKLLMIEPLEKM